MERKLAAILAADVVGYTSLMERNEADTFERLRVYRKELFEPEIARHHGRIFKLMGDGLLAEFASVVDAVECAIVLQRGMAERNIGVPKGQRIDVRIGVNLGDVIVEGEDRHGEGVNIAARLQGLAEPGGICVSRTVYSHVKNKLPLAFEAMGEQQVKNLAEPVTVYRVGMTAASKSTGPEPPQPALAVPGNPSIAVLPFTNMSGDPEQEYFSDGITEDIITDLSKISALFVVARTSVFTYKGKLVDVQEVSRRFGVTSVLEGSVRKAGSRVRVTAQLIDGRTGGHVWADRYDRDLTDIFAIQDEITQSIVDQLKIKLLPGEKSAIKSTPTEDIEAYSYYLRGRKFFHMHTKSYALLARRMFAKATELDPLYARAYAGIANCDSFLYVNYSLDIPLDDILAASTKALELDPGLAEAHASRGLALYNCKRDAEATAAFEQAIALDPDLFEGHFFYARFCYSQGDFERAARHLERAAELMPDDYRATLVLRNAYEALGRRADSEAAARRGLERAERALELHPDNPHPAYAGACALAALGEPDRAREWASRALAIDRDDPMVQYNIACMHSLLGELDRAIDLLVPLLPHLNHGRKAWLKHDPDLDPIRSHPRYQALLP
jgi:adenylate cyclase